MSTVGMGLQGVDESVTTGKTSVFEDLIKQQVYDKEQLIKAAAQSDMHPIVKMKTVQRIQSLEGTRLQEYLWNMLLAREGLGVNQKRIYRKSILG